MAASAGSWQLSWKGWRRGHAIFPHYLAGSLQVLCEPHFAFFRFVLLAWARMPPCCGMWKVRRPSLRVVRLPVAWKGEENKANLNQELRRAGPGRVESALMTGFWNAAFTQGSSSCLFYN